MTRLAAIVSLILSTSLPAQVFTWTDAGDSLGNPHMASSIHVGSDPASQALAAARLRARPLAMRAVILSSFARGVFDHPADADQIAAWPAGVSAMRAELQSVLRALPHVAHVIGDNEGGPNTYNTPPELWPRVAAKLGVPVPDQHTGRGYDDYNNPLADAGRVALSQCLSVFNSAPTRSNWNELLAAPADNALDVNGHLIATRRLSGSVQSVALYATKGLNPQTQTPYPCLVYSVNLLRIGLRHGAIIPWLAGDNIDDRGAMTGSPYWDELQRHALILAGGKAYLFDLGGVDVAKRFSPILNDVLAHCGGCAGSHASLTTLRDDAPVIVTARIVPPVRWFGLTLRTGRVYGRVTFAPGVEQAAVVLAGKAYTVRPDAGSVGCWINVRLSGAQR